MTRDDIIHMAQVSGLHAFYGTDSIERFAALVAAAEREACAEIVDANAKVCANNSMLQNVLRGNATAIRARGEI